MPKISDTGAMVKRRDGRRAALVLLCAACFQAACAKVEPIEQDQNGDYPGFIDKASDVSPVTTTDASPANAAANTNEDPAPVPANEANQVEP